MKRLLLNIILLLLPAGWTALVHGQAKGSFEVQHISSISGSSNDMAPVIIKDGILFCSNRKTNPFLTRKNYEGVRLYDLFFAPFDTEGKPGKPVRYATGLAKNANIGPACLTTDGNTLWFTRNYTSGDKLKRKEANNLGIYSAKRQGNSWTDIEPFPYNDPSFNLSYPFISPDGRYLFFSSDMTGSIGKYDIFMSEYANGKWSRPVNLGPNVNSEFAEIHPFLHSSGRLYFASDRPGGMGGLDIYYSTLSYGSWSKPVRLDEPINSEADDFAFYAIPGGQEGYFSSNRRKFSDDIYRFATTIIRWSNCDTIQENNYCFLFVEENALKNDTIDVKFKWEWNFGDGATAEGVTAKHCYNGPGVYDISLDIVNLITGGIEKRQASYVLEVIDAEQPIISSPEKVMTGETFVLDARKSNLPGMKVARYYWNFGDETVATGIEVRKSFPLPGTYNIQLIVTSEPDQAGVVREVCVCRDIEVGNSVN